MTEEKPSSRNPWLWVPSLYLSEGLPYVIVMTVSVVMYKRLGISNTDIALYTSWLYIPWVIKPLWSPVVDILRTKRFWIIIMQLVIGAALAGVALTVQAPDFFRYTLVFFWLLAFSSATHDIAIDGFYMLGLSKHQQAWFVGIRSTFYRLAMITGQGLLVILAGYLETLNENNISIAWLITFVIMAVLFLVFFIYHKFILPYPAEDVSSKNSLRNFFGEFSNTFALFFKKKKIIVILVFILLYRLGEAQLTKIAPLFLLDNTDAGGLGLTTEQYGLVYGTVGVISLTLGGILGGFLCARNGLKYWIWWMVAAINVPDLVYVYLSYFQTGNFLLVNLLVSLEQFGYGVGFTAFLLYIMYISEGEHKTSHYAIATGFMALGMMIPSMLSGWIQENIGYRLFFIWVCIATIPGFILIRFIPLDPEFGKKTDKTTTQ